MQTSYDWGKVDPVRRARIADAEEIVKRMNKGQSFYDWLHIGEGLTEWRDAACELAGTQDLDAQAYRDAWGTAKPLYPKLAEVANDKAERSYSIWMWENHQVLEEWHAGLDDKQRRAWNHPRSIWRHSDLGKAAQAALKAAREPKARPDEERRKRSAAAAIDESVRDLRAVADDIVTVTGGASALSYDMDPDLIDKSARNFAAVYGTEDSVRFILALLKGPLNVYDPLSRIGEHIVQSLAVLRNMKRAAERQAKRQAEKQAEPPRLAPRRGDATEWAKAAWLANPQASDRDIAKAAGVGQGTARRARHQLQETGELPMKAN